MFWIILALLSGLGDATLYALMKKAKNMTGMLSVFVQYTFGLPFVLIGLVFFYPETINNWVYLIAFIDSVVLACIMMLLFRAFQSAHLSLTVPLLSFTPLFLLFVAPLIVNESPGSSLGYVGVLLIVVGAYILNLEKRKNDILGPFKALFTNVGPRCALTASFLMALMASIFKIGITMSNPFYFASLNFVLIPLFLLPFVIKGLKKNVQAIKENLPLCFGMGLSNSFMSITIGLSMLTAIVPYAVSLKRSSVLFGMAYSHFLFKEQNIKGRLFGTFIMVAGATLIIVS